MVKKIAFVMISAALVLTMALSASAALNRVLITDAGDFFDTNDQVVISNTSFNSGQQWQAGDYAEIAFPFQEFMEDSSGNIYPSLLSDSFVEDGTFNSNSVRFTFNAQPAYNGMTTFYPNIYITNSKSITLFPGDTMYFYVMVSNAFVGNSYNDRLWYNYVSGVTVGEGGGIPSPYYSPADESTFTYKIDTFTVNNQWSGNLDRKLQRISIINETKSNLSFTAMQISLGQSLEDGTPRTRGGDTGVNYIYINLCLSSVVRYNDSTDNSEILGAMGTLDDKLGNIQNALDRDETYDEYLPDQDDLAEKDQLDQKEQDAVADFQNVINQAQGIITGADMSTANMWWQDLYTKIFEFGVIPIMLVLWSGFIVIRALLGR